MADDYEKAAPPVKMIQQVNSATCWLASCRMMHQWKNPNYTPIYDEADDPELEKPPRDAVLRKLYDKAQTDASVDLWTWLLDGIGTTDAIPLARAMGLNWGGGGQLEAWQFADAISRWGPLLAIGSWNTRSHVLVITGAEKTDDDGTDTVHKLLMHNPWPGGMQKGSVNWYNKGLGVWEHTSGQNMHW